MVVIEYGTRQLEVAIPPDRVIVHHRGPAPLQDPVEAIREGLLTPVAYPALRRALTPDDRVTVVMDAQLSGMGRLLVPILEHILSAGVAAEAITLLCAEPGQSEAWLDELPEHLEEVHVEEHDPTERKKLAYLATTRGGRRLYLNRTVVDADQVVVVTTRRYDRQLGYGGAEGALFPALSDEQTRQELGKIYQMEVPGEEAWPVREEATEAAWLLGQPFYVQLIPAVGGGVAHVVAGAMEALQEGQRMLDASWKVTLPRRADLVVVGLAGDPVRHRFADLAEAVGCGMRVVRPGGRIVVLSEANPAIDASLEPLFRAEDPQQALPRLLQASLPGMDAAITWVRGVSHARVSLLSRLPGQMVEDLFATPLDDPAQVQRLVTEGGECAFLQDGHRLLAILG